jgi:hypothetical protein
VLAIITDGLRPTIGFASTAMLSSCPSALNAIEGDAVEIEILLRLLLAKGEMHKRSVGLFR